MRGCGHASSRNHPTLCAYYSIIWHLLLFSRSVLSDSLWPPWTVADQAPLSMGFPRQESWSRLPFPPPGNLPDPGMESASPVLAGRFLTMEPPGKLSVLYDKPANVILWTVLAHYKTWGRGWWEPPIYSQSERSMEGLETQCLWLVSAMGAVFGTEPLNLGFDMKPR